MVKNKTPQLPLAGVRILDLSMWFAGPMCTRLLADMGAEVIKIESVGHVDPWRGPVSVEMARLQFPARPENNRPYDVSPGFNLENRNKYGITLDLRHPKAKEIFRNLVKISDVVVENYSPRVMPKLGFSYEALKEINPKLVMMSLPALGSTGPDKDYRAFGQTIDCMSGMAYLTGYLGEEPMLQSGLSYGDPLSGMNAAFGVVAAILRRRRTGEGIHIELSQVEGLIAFNADSILDYTMNGRIRERMGNRDRSMAPQGTYRCLGIDKWVSLAVPSDEVWQKFCAAIGNPAWTQEARFGDAISRYENQDEMDKLIEGWTLQHNNYEVMAILQAVGVPAGPGLDSQELLNEPHLNARGYYEIKSHKVAGSFREIGPFALFSKTPLHIRMAAPGFGEHNEYVLGKLLGISAEEMAALQAENIIGDKPLEKQQGSM
ncbi:MAG: CoA transferase [Dehalococcoidales bacterium]|nr:CoA transferase [Dehalococcoidales bacterium]